MLNAYLIRTYAKTLYIVFDLKGLSIWRSLEQQNIKNLKIHQKLLGIIG
ncbi:MAG: hypothetical protein F6K24_18855 [Okeania sp. SIO2D1]|nr:hypothetical protein [Okeania sp. SIO2D1]